MISFIIHLLEVLFMENYIFVKKVDFVLMSFIGASLGEKHKNHHMFDESDYFVSFILCDIQKIK